MSEGLVGWRHQQPDGCHADLPIQPCIPGADDAEKKLIVKALNEEGQRLGGSVGRLSEQADAIALLPSRNQTAAMGNYQLLDAELDRVNAVRDQIKYTEEIASMVLANQAQLNARNQQIRTANETTDLTWQRRRPAGAS